MTVKTPNWISLVVQATISTHLHQWQVRNNHQHGREVADTQLALTTKAFHDTKTLYQDKSDFPPQLQKALYETFDEHKKANTTAYRLRRWLGMWKHTLSSNR